VRIGLELWNEAELPAVTVWAPSEKTEAGSARGTGPRELERDIVLEVRAWATGDDDEAAANAMLGLALEVEDALGADPHLGQKPTIGDSFFDGAEYEIGDVGARLVARATQRFPATCIRHTQTFAALDDLEQVEVTHNLGNDVHEDDQAVDLIDIEQDEEE
jgi:hypothetical protein